LRPPGRTPTRCALHSRTSRIAEGEHDALNDTAVGEVAEVLQALSDGEALLAPARKDADEVRVALADVKNRRGRARRAE